MADTKVTKKTSKVNGQISQEVQNAADAAAAGYNPSVAVQQAAANLAAAEGVRPDFASSYQSQLSDIYNQVMNQGPFNYNFNTDALYKQYANQYTQNAKNAAQASMQSSNNLTGGGGNSYSNIVAQQNYQNAISQLNNVIPELYDIAYARYQNANNDAINKLAAANTMYGNEYAQYRDAVSDYNTNRAYARGAYENERAYDYNKFLNDRNYANNAYWNEANASQVDTTYDDGKVKASKSSSKIDNKYQGIMDENGKYIRVLDDYKTAIWMRSVAMNKKGGKASDSQIVKNLWKAYENEDFKEGDLIYMATKLGVLDKL